MSVESRARLPVVALRVASVLTVGLTVLSIYALHESRTDDAFITFRYGQNIARGLGAVFNPGSRILGSTSPGELLLSAVVYPVAGLEGTPSWMAAFGCVAWMAQVVLVFLILRRAFGDWTAALGALALLLGCAGSDGRVSLETNQVVALNLGALWMAMDSRWRSAALLAGLAVLFRPDALVFGLPLAVVCIYEKRAQSLGPALIFLAVLAPWMLFATYYYGSPLPMSAVTKFQRVGIPVYAEHIFDHLGAFVWPDKPAVTWLLWVLGVAGALRLFKRGRWYVLLAVYPFAHYAAYLKLRPFTAHSWHLYPGEAMILVLAMVALGGLIQGLRPLGRWVGVAAAVGLLGSGSIHVAERMTTYQDSRWSGGRHQAYREVATFLSEHGDREQEYFASVEVGTVAYYSDFPAMDLGWLVSPRGMLLDEGELRWLLVDPVYRFLVPAGAPRVFSVERDGIRAEVYDLWNGNSDSDTAGRIHWSDWAL
jgi:hypothetical protein